MEEPLLPVENNSANGVPGPYPLLRGNKSMQVLEYQPGERLVLKFRRPIGWWAYGVRVIGIGLVGFLFFQNVTQDAGMTGFAWFFAFLFLLGIAETIINPIFERRFNRIEIDAKKGIFFRQWDSWKVIRESWEAREFSNTGKQKVFMSRAIRKHSEKKSEKNEAPFLEIWGMTPKGKKLLISLRRGNYKSIEKEASALNELLVSFRDTFRDDFVVDEDFM